MSVAAVVDLEADQGADFGFQLYWLDPTMTPYQLLEPMRMEVRRLDDLQLVTAVSSGAGITFNPAGGLIQVLIPASTTDTIKADTYVYDLFVSYQENPTSTRRRRLIRGRFILNQKVTQTL